MTGSRIVILRYQVLSSVLLLLGLVGPLGSPAGAQGLAAGDFNGDGFADLAVGVPDEDVEIGIVRVDAGAVNVLYGGAAAGLAAAGNELLNQEVTDVSDTSEDDDNFGYSLAAGDFDQDGFDDLAVGVPGEAVSTVGGAAAGAVHVFYGGPNGFIFLGSTGNLLVDDRLWHRNSTGVLETADLGDNFGWSLAAGDANGDGYDDLAAGVPNDDPAGVTNAGSVHLLHGSSLGLVADDIPATAAVDEDDQVWHQDVGTIVNVSEPGDHFGWSVAMGDFDGDGFHDLAVGGPGESVGPAVDPDPAAGPAGAGAVNAIYGSGAGLTDAGDETFFQEAPGLVGIEDTAEEADGFGFSLAAGDFDGDGFDDLAIGVRGEDYEGLLAIFVDVGAVHVVYGAVGGGLSLGGDQFWHQDSANADGAAEDTREAGDAFGSSLAAGDLNGDGFDDLIVGVPFEDVGAVVNAGAAAVFHGRAGDGIHLAGDQLWHQDSAGVLEISEAGDQFAASLAAGDFNGDGHADLAAGVPAETLGAVEHAGAVNVLHGLGGGLVSANIATTPLVNEDDQLWHQDTAGVTDVNESHDHFGGAL